MSYVCEKMAPLRVRRLGIDTHHQPTLFLHAESPICRSEGFQSLSRIRVDAEGEQIIASLNIITSDLLDVNEAGFSESAWNRLKLTPDSSVYLSHPRPLQSLSHLRSKVYGHRLNKAQFDEIIADIINGRYADLHIAAFVTACGDKGLDDDEITDLTQAMVDAGAKIDWGKTPVMDKHCVGGLPGNRTTPIVVSIVTACGLTMPKTSSRAITSPAGTADTLETLTNVSLTLEQIRDVVHQEGGCLAWGGSVKLSPADDQLIQVERALDIDSEGQLVASVLSKKIAAGATDVLIDIPVGPTAKVRSTDAAEKLSHSFLTVAKNLGLNVRTLISDGNQPVGQGIGPALEARDVLAVLQNSADAPQDLRDRALTLAANLLEMSGYSAAGEGLSDAAKTLDSGAAWQKFKQICQAQGGLKEPPVAPYRYELVAPHAGRVTAIDNRQLARIAKLAGAPADQAAGVDLHVKLHQQVSANQPLLTIHAESAGELNYAVDYLIDHKTVLTLNTDTQEPA